MDKVVLLREWPQPSGVPEPVVLADDTMLVVRYKTEGDAQVIIKFPLVHIFAFGAPNDEAMGGHPLAVKGLKFYSVHRIEDSSWIRKLERCNSVHPKHNRKHFMEDHVHYVFTFQDSTLELVAAEGIFWKPEINICSSVTEAENVWKEKTSAEQPNQLDHQ